MTDHDETRLLTGFRERMEGIERQVPDPPMPPPFTRLRALPAPQDRPPKLAAAVALVGAVLVLAVGVGPLLWASLPADPGGPSDSPVASPPASAVAPGEWVLLAGTFRGSPLPLPPDDPITLVVADVQWSGFGGCNHFWADVERSDANVVVGDVVASAQGCGEPIDNAESAFLDALPTVTRIDASRPDELVLRGPEVELRFVRSSTPPVIPSPTLVPVPTQDPPTQTPEPCMGAQIFGQLVAHPVWGIALAEEGGTSVVRVVWPHGFAGRWEDRLALADADGTVMAYVSDRVELGGGHGGDGSWYACRYVNVLVPTPGVPSFDTPTGAWGLASGVVDGRSMALLVDYPVTLVVEPGRTGGTAACNLYGAEINVVDGAVEARVTAVTAMLCEDPAMAVEKAYQRALPRVSRMVIQGRTLTLSGDGVELRYALLDPPQVDEVTDRLWLLEELTTEEGGTTAARGDDATLLLHSDGTLEGSTGSRRLTGKWIVYGHEIKTPELGADGDVPPPDLAAQDSHVLGVLGSFVPRIEGDRLILSSPRGGELVYGLVPVVPPTPAGATPDAEPTAPNGDEAGNIRHIDPGPLRGRSHHSAVWAGTDMIVWGGLPGTGEQAASDGAIYDPATGQWRPIADGPLRPRFNHTAVWTGREMIVVGGNGNPEVEAHSDGAAYDPSTDTWRPIAEAPDGRSGHSAVWTGSRLIVWGGSVAGGAVTSDGLAYDPVADAWEELPSVAVEPRSGHSAVWTGDGMIVWGGAGADVLTGALGDGFTYDPDDGSVTSIGRDHLEPRAGHSAVWIGDRMLVWGGTTRRPSVRAPYSDGAAYEPGSQWWLINLIPSAGRFSHSAVWTGEEMLIWGGRSDVSGSASADGFAYDPEALHECTDLQQLPPVSDDSGIDPTNEIADIVFTAEGSNEQFVRIHYNDQSCRAHPVLGPMIEMLLSDE